MQNQLYFFPFFLFLIFWSSIQVSAVDVDRSIPDAVLSRFSKLEIGQNVIGLSENHLTVEGSVDRIPVLSSELNKLVGGETTVLHKSIFKHNFPYFS